MDRPWITRTAIRIGDMHPIRAIRIYTTRDGDINIRMEENGRAVGDNSASGDNTAEMEFCLSGGRSNHTRQALMALMDAIDRDNREHPISFEDETD